MPRLTWRAVLSRRLARHHLVKPAPRAKLADVVAQVCGIHAQVMTSAEISLGLRIAGLTKKEFDDALWEERELLKTYGIRGTVHVLPTRELGLWLAALRACERSEDEPRRLKLFGPTVKQRDDIADAIAEALVGRRLTREELGEEVARRVGRWAVDRTVNAFNVAWKVWQVGIGAAALRGTLCFGPPIGARVTFVSPADWIGKATSPPEPTAFRELFRRHLIAYGPATDAEFAQWANTDPPRIRALAKALGDEIETVEVEGAGAWQVAGDGDAHPVSTTHLLPRFDCYAVGSHPRDVVVPPAIVAKAAAGLLSRSAGSGRAFLVGPMPVLVIDGAIAGIWDSKCTAKHIAITVQPFVRLDAGRRAGIEAAAMRIGEIVGREASLTIGKVGTRPHL